MSNNLEKMLERLRSALQDADLLMLSEQTGISRATFYNWMKNGNAPLNKLWLLEKAGIDVTYILTGQSTQKSETHTLKPDEAALLDNYRNSPDAQKDLLKATSAAFAEQNNASQRA